MDNHPIASASPLPWRDAPLGELVRLAWPIMVSLLSYSAMTVVDTLFISRLGAASLAGVGLGGVSSFILVCFGFGLLRAAQTLVAQSTGAGHCSTAPAYLGAGLALAVVLGLAIACVGQIVSPAIASISATAEAARHARAYLDVRLLGSVPVLLYVALREVRYGVGDSRTPMRAAVAANVLHIGLAYVFIFVLDGGVAGAAWATVASESVEALILALASRDGLRQIGRTRRQHVLALWELGWPLGVQFLMEMGAFAILTAIVAAWRQVDMAAHQIALQVIHVSFLPAFAVSEAGSVLAGQAVGAGRSDLVRRVGHAALGAAAMYAGICTLILLIAAGPIVAAFTSEPELAHTARMLLYVACLFQIADAANMVARGTLRGSGDVRFAAWVGISVAWLAQPPLAWLLGHVFGLGAVGAWLALSVEICTGATIMWWRVEHEGWRPAANRYHARAHAVVA